MKSFYIGIDIQVRRKCSYAVINDIGTLNVINFSRLVCNSNKSFFFFYDCVDSYVRA